MRTIMLWGIFILTLLCIIFVAEELLHDIGRGAEEEKIREDEREQIKKKYARMIANRYGTAPGFARELIEDFTDMMKEKKNE